MKSQLSLRGAALRPIMKPDSDSHRTRRHRGITIRRATTDDIPSLFTIRVSVRENHLNLAQLAERGVTPDSWAELLASEDSRTWVIEDEGKMCGFSVADGKSGTITAIFVRPDAEGRGYGRLLLEAAEEWLFERGLDTIRLQTGEEQDNRAHGFYRAGGWMMTGPADHGDVHYEKRRRV